MDTKKKGNSAPKKDRPMENVVCYYNGSPGHLASKCQKRIDDRARGVWRPTVRDPETNKTQWDQMSKEQRNRGVKIWGKPSAQSSVAAAPQPGGGGAQEQQVSCAGAVSAPRGSLEQDYGDYLRRSRRPGN